MTEDDIAALAAALPAWKVFQRFFPGVAVESRQSGPDAPEELAFPDGFTPPDAAKMDALRRDLAREILGSQYQRDRSAKYLPAGDTLDGVLKALAALKDQGTQLPADTIAVLDHWQAVKARHPKPAPTGASANA